MSALAFPLEEHPVLDLLTVCDQLDEWSALLEERARQGAAPTVAYSADRRTAAVTLAARFSGTPVELRALDRLRLDRGDLLVVVSSDGDGPPLALRRLVRSGARIWSVTGPGPNAVADHSHDSVVVPLADPAMLARAHEIVVQRLIARPPPPPKRGRP